MKTTITIESEGTRETYSGGNTDGYVVVIDTVDGDETKILVSTSWDDTVQFKDISFASIVNARSYAFLLLCPLRDQDNC